MPGSPGPEIPMTPRSSRSRSPRRGASPVRDLLRIEIPARPARNRRSPRRRRARRYNLAMANTFMPRSPRAERAIETPPIRRY
jgi:hypothetical protein